MQPIAQSAQLRMLGGHALKGEHLLGQRGAGSMSG